jgi:hypothetical protein
VTTVCVATCTVSAVGWSRATSVSTRTRGVSSFLGAAMPTKVTPLDESIAEAKRELDAARRDGCVDDIALWVKKLDYRLDRKLAAMKTRSELVK